MTRHSSLQATLRHLTRPTRVRDLARDLGVTYEQARGNVRVLVERGDVTRVQQGTYVITQAGLARLHRTSSTEAPVPRRPARLTYPVRVPPGRGWTPERRAWFQSAYPRLGQQACADLLGTTESAVATMACREGLTLGDADGFIRLSTLATLLGVSYNGLYEHAVRDGVARKPRSGGRGVTVPETWADAMAARHAAPRPDEVPLRSLRQEGRISQREARRLAQAYGQLRRPRDGGHPQIFVPSHVVPRCTPAPRTRRSVGRIGVLDALDQHGELTVTELARVLRLGATTLRRHLALLESQGVIIRTGIGTKLDPYRYARTPQHATLPSRAPFPPLSA